MGRTSKDDELELEFDLERLITDTLNGLPAAYSTVGVQRSNYCI